MKKSFKQRVLSAPVIGYGARVINNGLKSPIQQQELNQRIDKALRENNRLHSQLAKASAKLKDTESSISSLLESRDNLQQQFSLLERNLSANPDVGDAKAKAPNQSLFADDHILDVFYTKFEDRFRGSEDIISKRLEEHLHLFTNSTVDFKRHPVLDIGTGRGELLQLLKDNNVRGLGIDINIDMVERCKAKGIEAIQGDAVEFLQESKPQSFGAITGFHIVEHIPFNILLRLFSAAHASLAKNGFVLFETPNPENIIVGSCGFYMDPSHLHPLPPDLLAFALEISGFRKVEIMRIHPVEHKDQGKVPEEFINRFYGPRDYAVIGYK